MSDFGERRDGDGRVVRSRARVGTRVEIASGDVPARTDDDDDDDDDEAALVGETDIGVTVVARDGDGG